MPSKKHQSYIESNNAFMAKIEDLVREVVIQNNIPYYRIESRMDYLAGPENTPESYLPVIRVITYFEDTISQISSIIRREFNIWKEKSNDRKNLRVDTFSYKYVQFFAELKNDRRELTEYRRYGNKKFEIQVCTMLQDAWSGIEKELGYDNAAIPEETKRDFYRVGALLEMADIEFCKIKSVLNKRNANNVDSVDSPDLIDDIAEYNNDNEFTGNTYSDHFVSAIRDTPVGKPEAVQQETPAVAHIADTPALFVVPAQPEPVAEPTYEPPVFAVPQMWEAPQPEVSIPEVTPLPTAEATQQVTLPPAVLQAPVAEVQTKTPEVKVVFASAIPSFVPVRAIPARTPGLAPQRVKAPVVTAEEPKPQPKPNLISISKVEPYKAAAEIPVQPAKEVVREVVAAPAVKIAATVAPVLTVTAAPPIIKEVAPPIVKEVAAIIQAPPVVKEVAAVIQAPPVPPAQPPVTYAPPVVQMPVIVAEPTLPVPPPVPFQVPAMEPVMMPMPAPAPIVVDLPRHEPSRTIPFPEPQPMPAVAASYETMQAPAAVAVMEKIAAPVIPAPEVAPERTAAAKVVEMIAEIEPAATKSAATFEDNTSINDATLREFVMANKLVKEVDQKIAERAGAKINSEIDIEGDVERLRFLKVFTLRQLNEKIVDNKNDIVAFAEKWIGKDNGGSFDSGICLFYLEYLLVGKKNDPAFAIEYVVKFISDNDYSARYIIPTYNSIRNTEVSNFSHLTLKV